MARPARLGPREKVRALPRPRSAAWRPLWGQRAGGRAPEELKGQGRTHRTVQPTLPLQWCSTLSEFLLPPKNPPKAFGKNC